jgi:hypothetical protein
MFLIDKRYCNNKKLITILYYYEIFIQTLEEIENPNINDYTTLSKNIIINLPKNITRLTFFDEFNQKIYLLQNLTHLTLGFNFNQKIDTLPKNLSHLTFGKKFNQKIVNFPKNLTHIIFDEHFNQNIVSYPKNLTYLKLTWQNKIILPRNIKNLKELILTYNDNLINNIPECVEKLYIWFYKYHEEIKIFNLPSTLKEIVIDNDIYIKFIKIPFGCKLTIGCIPRDYIYC